MKLMIKEYLFLFLICFIVNTYGQPDPRMLEKNTIVIPNDSLFSCYKEGVLVATDSNFKYLMWLNPIQKPTVVFDFIAKDDSLQNTSVLIAIAYYDKAIYFRAEALPTDGGCYLFHTDEYCSKNNIHPEKGDTLEIIITNWEPYKVSEIVYETAIIRGMLKDKQMRCQFLNSDKNRRRKNRFGRSCKDLLLFQSTFNYQ